MEKKYSINTENGLITSIEVDGVRYTRIEDIPDFEDRAQVQMLLADSWEFEGGDRVPSFPDMPPSWDSGSSPQFQPPQFPAKLFISIFGSVSAIMLGIAGYSGYLTTQAMAREQRTTGKVVDIEILESTFTDRRQYSDGRRSGNPLHYPIVEFSVPGKGRQTATLPGSWPPAYEKGDTVTILYDPANPREARPQSVGSDVMMWILPMITGSLGVVFLGATLLATWILKPLNPPDKGGL